MDERTNEQFKEWIRKNARFEFMVRIAVPANNPDDPREEASCVVHCLQDNKCTYADLQKLGDKQLIDMADTAVRHFIRVDAGCRVRLTEAGA